MSAETESCRSPGTASATLRPASAARRRAASEAERVLSAADDAASDTCSATVEAPSVAGRSAFARTQAAFAGISFSPVTATCDKRFRGRVVLAMRFLRLSESRPRDPRVEPG